MKPSLRQTIVKRRNESAVNLAGNLLFAGAFTWCALGVSLWFLAGAGIMSLSALANLVMLIQRTRALRFYDSSPVSYLAEIRHQFGAQ